MKSQNSLYALVILALSLLTVTAFSPYGWIVVTSSSGHAPTPIVSGLVVPPAIPTSASAPVPPIPAATLTPSSQDPLAGRKTFTGKLYRYPVSYPSDWTVRIIYFLKRGSSFVLQLVYEGKNYVDSFNQMLALFKFN